MLCSSTLFNYENEGGSRQHAFSGMHGLHDDLAQDHRLRDVLLFVRRKPQLRAQAEGDAFAPLVTALEQKFPYYFFILWSFGSPSATAKK